MNLQKMLKQAQEMQSKITDLQARLESEESEGSSGGGMVSVVLNGKNQLLKIHIDKQLLVPDEKEVLEDLIVAAFNDARNKVDNNFQDQMGKITGGLNLPAGLKLPF